MRTVSEVSKLSGVSVRTLHHYDAIGLLKPARVTGAGYRLYDDAALRRLQSILIFRELQFSLKEIKSILDSPAFDPRQALSEQIKLLELRRKHLGELINLARKIQEKGVIAMDFEPFHPTEFQAYAAEVKEKWGHTAAYGEYREKTAGKSRAELDAVGAELMALFTEIGGLRELPPSHRAVQEKVGGLQAFITKHYYRCTNEILLGLGEMYVSDLRMRRNIDTAGGEGTAAFVRQAIAIYCAAGQ